MNRATPILLALLCALLVAFILVFERDWSSTDEAHKHAASLYKIPAGEIAWISIKNPHDRILLKKTDGRWRIAEPVELTADGEAVDALVRELRNLEFARQFDAPDTEKGLEAYGLTPPAVVLRARWDGEEIELRLGARAPMGASVYAQTQKNVRRVYAIGASILDLLSRPASDWRSRRLVDFEPERVEEIRLANPSSKVRLEHRGDHWFLKSPLSARASAPRVLAILAALGRARIERFVSDDDSRLQDFGLKEPPVAVHLEVRDGDDAEVQFGSADPERPGATFARRPESSSIVSVSTNLLGVLFATAEDLRDRRLIPVEADAVERVVLTRGDVRMEAVREGGVWKIVPPGELEMSPANNEAVARFVERCCDLQVLRFTADAVTDPTALGLDKPIARLELWTRAGSEPAEGRPVAGGRRLDATLIVAPPKTNICDCVVEPEPFVVGITESDLAPLKAEPWEWRNKSVWRLNGPVSSFAVTRGSSEYRLSLTRSRWDADPPGTIDQASANSVADLLGRLEAKSWLGPTPAGKMDAPVATFTIEGGAILRVWHEDDRWIGWAEGGGAPDLFFELARPEAALLTHPISEADRSPEPPANKPVAPDPAARGPAEVKKR